MDQHCCLSVPHSTAAYWFLLHSIAMAVGIDFFCCQTITCHHYSSSFNLFWLILQFCSLSRSQTRWYSSANSRYA